MAGREKGFRGMSSIVRSVFAMKDAKAMKESGLNASVNKTGDIMVDGKKVNKFTKEKTGGYSIDYAPMDTALGSKKDSL